MSIIRTTTLGSTNSMLNYITGGESRYNNLAQQAASGLKISKPSDDPASTKAILNINTRLEQLSAYSENMKMAQNELNVLDDTFNSFADAIQNATTLANQAANGTYTPSDMKNIKAQVDQIMQQVASLGNTQYNGNYIFSGTSTATPAFDVVTDASGNVTSITYTGTPSTGEYQRYVQVADSMNIAINTTGDQLLGSYSAGPPESGSGLLYTLGTLSTALGNGDQAAVAASLGPLDNDLDTVLAAQAKFASVSQRFDMTKSSNQTMTTQLKASRSELQDADLAEVLTNLTAQQTALKATLSVTSQLLSGVSLLDFL